MSSHHDGAEVNAQGGGYGNAMQEEGQGSAEALRVAVHQICVAYPWGCVTFTLPKFRRERHGTLGIGLRTASTALSADLRRPYKNYET